MRNKQFSSTARELTGIRKASQQFVSQPPPGVTSSSEPLQVVNDNQGAVAALCNLTGKTETLLLAAAIWKFIVANKMQVSFQWFPRTTSEVMEADRLSKYVDTSDWALSRQFLTEAVTRQLGQSPGAVPQSGRRGRRISICSLTPRHTRFSIT